MRLSVIAVDHDQIRGATGARHVLGAVTNDDAESGTVLRHVKALARNRHHLRINLENPDIGRGHVVMNKFGNRPAAKADHDNTARFRIEQQERHH